MGKGRVGFASCSRESDSFLERVADLAYNSLSIAEEGMTYPLPQPGSFSDRTSIWDRQLRGRSFEEKADQALTLEREARKFDRRVTRVRGAHYEEREETVVLRNSHGFEGRYTKTLCELSLMVMAEERGRQESAWESDFSSSFEGLKAAEVARRAAERAVALLGAAPIQSRKAPALLEPAVGASLLGVLSASFLGDQVMKGRSALKGRLGETIYSKEIRLMDDGNRAGGYGSCPFDGEGSRTGGATVVESGILKNFLQDSLSAKRLEMPVTGNAVRPVYKEPPRPGVTNFFLEPGAKSPEALRHEMGHGFWITDLIGVHTADPVTGDFSLGAVGFWVEGGERKSAVRGVAVSGNLHDLMKKVIAVGSDLRFYESVGAPTLLVSEIDIGGS